MWKEGRDMESLTTLLATNPYPGRGIVVGLTPDGRHAALAYFVMGRSANSRNRILSAENGVVYTRAWDERQLTDPSLTLYPALRALGNQTILTNGVQTETIYQYLKRGQSFEAALRTWAYEPDEPHFTPRISAVVTVDGKLAYCLSVLRERKGTTLRSFFEYAGLPGEGHFIHTYLGDGYPLPAFEGEPFSVGIMDDQDDWTRLIWHSLHSENRVALLTRFIALADSAEHTKIVNQRGNEE
jgi:IMP cyclohydrolase